MEQTDKNGASNGRDPTTGRFLPGNKCSPGNGGRKAVEFDRAAMMDEAIPSARWRKMMEAQAQKAEGGDTYAYKVLWEFRFGKAKESVDLTSAGQALIPWEMALLAIEEAEKRRRQSGPQTS